MKKTLAALCLCCSSAFAADGCVAVSGAQVHLGELLPVEGEAARTVLGWAPAPGLVRWFRGPELARAAARAGLTLPTPHDLCVERRARVYSAAEILEALKTAAPEGARIELLESARARLPEGQLRFEWRGLSRTTVHAEPNRYLWRGLVVYDGTRTAPLWADVRVSVPRRGVYARRELVSGDILKDEDLELLDAERPALEPVPAAQLDAAVGRQVRRLIAAGAPVVEAWLAAPVLVARGENVTVLAESGSAVVKTQAVAEQPARAGESVLLRNTVSGQRFRARVDGKGMAHAELQPEVLPGRGAAARRPVLGRQAAPQAQAR